jgi:hypothetical protein
MGGDGTGVAHPATWDEFAADDPELAATVRAAFAIRKHATMATLRADGSPRISGTEVEFRDGAVLLGMPRDSRKAGDLRRDPRVAVHSPTVDPAPDGSWAGEAKLSGVARWTDGPASAPLDAVWARVELSSVVCTGLTDGRDQLRIRLWRPGRGRQEMVRS